MAGDISVCLNHENLLSLTNHFPFLPFQCPIFYDVLQHFHTAFIEFSCLSGSVFSFFYTQKGCQCPAYERVRYIKLRFEEYMLCPDEMSRPFGVYQTGIYILPSNCQHSLTRHRQALPTQWRTSPWPEDFALRLSCNCQTSPVLWDVSAFQRVPNAPQLLADMHSDLQGRLCAPVPSAEGTVDCCLPCPITDWVYSDGP